MKFKPPSTAGLQLPATLIQRRSHLQISKVGSVHSVMR